MHIAFASDAMLGHLTPMIPYMQTLHNRGHTITCFHDTDPKNRKKLVSCGLESVTSVTCDLPDVKKDGPTAVMGGGPMYQCMLDHYTDATPDVVVYDFFVSSAADAADHFGCPAVCVFPNAAVSVNPSLVIPNEAGVVNQGWCLLMDAAEAVIARFMLFMRNRNRAKRSLPPLIEQDIWPCKTMQRLTIGCTGLGLEFAHKAVSPLFVMVGPALPDAPEPLSHFRELEEWVNAQVKPIVYVAFGTMFDHTEKTVTVLQQQLVDSDVAVLWALPEDQQKWLKATEKHWRVEKFAPQLSLLASGKISAFVSHCGSNSLYEALLNKVPIVACPGFADQPGNAVRIEVAGVGCIARGGLSGVRHALSDVVGSGLNYQYKARAEKLCDLLATYGGAERAGTLIEAAGRFGYAHMIPKVRRRSWFRTVLCGGLVSTACYYVYLRKLR